MENTHNTELADELKLRIDNQTRIKNRIDHSVVLLKHLQVKNLPWVEIQNRRYESHLSQNCIDSILVLIELDLRKNIKNLEDEAKAALHWD
jgi:hypothetical protein